MGRLDNILHATAEYYEADPLLVRTSRREFKELVNSRQMFWFIAYKLTKPDPSTGYSKYSLNYLAKYTNKKTHTAVLSGIRKIQNELEIGFKPHLDDIKNITDILEEPDFYKRAEEMYKKKKQHEKV